jgi:di/tricarboxylate transporter
LYFHAWRIRQELGLSLFEIAHTKTSAIAQILNGAVGLLSMLLAFVLKPAYASDAGYVYLLAAAVGLWRWRRRAHARTTRNLFPKT